MAMTCSRFFSTASVPFCAALYIHLTECLQWKHMSLIFLNLFLCDSTGKALLVIVLAMLFVCIRNFELTWLPTCYFLAVLVGNVHNCTGVLSRHRHHSNHHSQQDQWFPHFSNNMASIHHHIVQAKQQKIVQDLRLFSTHSLAAEMWECFYSCINEIMLYTLSNVSFVDARTKGSSGYNTLCFACSSSCKIHFEMESPFLHDSQWPNSPKQLAIYLVLHY